MRLSIRLVVNRGEVFAKVTRRGEGVQLVGWFFGSSVAEVFDQIRRGQA